MNRKIKFFKINHNYSKREKNCGSQASTQILSGNNWTGYKPTKPDKKGLKTSKYMIKCLRPIKNIEWLANGPAHSAK
jgi:hypothetical protein